jgi:uncharacterized protein YbjT (DUF2867 family)
MATTRWRHRQTRASTSSPARGFEFIARIADFNTHDGTVPMPPLLFQPEAADDVAAALADIAVSAPVRGTVELAGPERFRLDELVRRFLGATNDPRQVVPDARAPYYGLEVNDERALIPGDNPRIGRIRFADWLSQSAGGPEGPHQPQPEGASA